MGSNMIPYSITVGEKNTYFVIDLYELIKSEKSEEVIFLKYTNDSVIPYDYQVLKRSENKLMKKTMEKFHSFYRDDGEEISNEGEDGKELVGENELGYRNPTNRIVRNY